MTHRTSGTPATTNPMTIPIPPTSGDLPGIERPEFSCTPPNVLDEECCKEAWDLVSAAIDAEDLQHGRRSRKIYKAFEDALTVAVNQTDIDVITKRRNDELGHSANTQNTRVRQLLQNYQEYAAENCCTEPSPGQGSSTGGD